MKNTLCIYHKNCQDGFAAAWVIGRFLGFDNVEFLAADYGDEIPDLTGRVVYIVDFSYHPDRLIPAAANASEVIIYDHHDTAITQWKAADAAGQIPDHISFETLRGHAGAMIAWKQCFPFKQAPHLFVLLEDYDMWYKTYPASELVVAALDARGYAQSEDWDGFGKCVDQQHFEYEALVSEGKIIAAGNRSMLTRILARNSTMISFAGYNVPIANVPSEYRSEAGEILSKNQPFSITYDDWLLAGIRKFSLRSSSDSGVNVRLIAEQHGGGGHDSAASFTMPIEDTLMLRL